MWAAFAQIPAHLQRGMLSSHPRIISLGEPLIRRTDMSRAIGFITAIAVLWASNAIAQSAEPQPAARIVVDQPLAEPLSRGVVILQYRTENLQIVPVFGPKALDVSPRIGHLHVAVDGASWVWAETSGGPIIVAGLPAGPHKVEITPVNANHQPLDRSIVIEFVIPGGKAAK
jgi:uncharacterized protein DUF6130